MINKEHDAPPKNEGPHIPSRKLLLLSLLSTLSYLVVAILIFRYLQEQNLYSAFDHGYKTSFQLFVGLLSGTFPAVIIGFIIRRPPVADILNDFYIVKIVSEMNLNRFDRWQLSLFAGAGEELLFRGAIQPLLGIWVTSAIFIGIHGYFKFTSIGHIIFGVMMFSLSIMLGYLFEHAGLIAAMSAHAIYDVIMLKMVQKN